MPTRIPGLDSLESASHDAAAAATVLNYDPMVAMQRELRRRA